MMTDDRAQTPLPISTRREGKTLILECHDGDLFQGKVQENPYLNFEMLEKAIRQKKFEVISKNKDQIRIQVSITILELNSQEFMLRKKLEEKIESLSEKNLHQEIELQTLKNRLQALEHLISNGHIAKWQEEDLDSKANFDIGCIYQITFSNGHSYISSLVCTGVLYFIHNNLASYTSSSSNRRANTTGWTVIKMMKMKTL